MTEATNGRLLTAQELAESGLTASGTLPLDLVDASPENPRRTLTEIDALAQNILKFGLMQPIFVRRKGERYEVLAGHRRRAAFLALRKQFPFDDRWLAIPAIVVSADDETAGYMLISAQAHIVSWRPKEQAAALERLVLAGLSLREIGERLNRSVAWASKRLRIYADVALSALVQTGRLDTGVAEELLGIKDFDTRKEYAERAADERWSQDRARGEVRAMRLDRRLTELGRRGLELLDILSSVQRKDIPTPIFSDLMILMGRLESLKDEALGGTPRIPTIEQAEKAAGVTPRTKERAVASKRGLRRKPGYKPRS